MTAFKDRNVVQKTNDIRYPYRMTIRLSVDEMQWLQDRTKTEGGTMSQVARRILFKNRDREENMTEAQAAAVRLQNLRALRESFKKIAASYDSFVAAYSNALHIVDREGNPAVNTQQTERTAESLLAMTARLQDGVNAMMREGGVKEVHKVVVPKKEQRKGDGGSAGITQITQLRFYTMERIICLGYLREDAVEYTSRSKEQKIRFRIMVERARGRQGEYNVFAAKSAIAEKLRAGVQVFVEGDFDENEKGDKIVFADVIRLAAQEAASL